MREGLSFFFKMKMLLVQDEARFSSSKMLEVCSFFNMRKITLIPLMIMKLSSCFLWMMMWNVRDFSRCFKCVKPFLLSYGCSVLEVFYSSFKSYSFKMIGFL